ncbi:hypothetical protein E2P61_05745 [Candidatus Bathyarchaeota archaeon]|nr:hypothetical protein E2P61_05745 [Candidatus Bathyarchaeota archaeon]
MDLSTLIGLDLSLLVGLVPYILIFGGIVAVSKLLSFFTKGSTGNLLRGLGYLGIFVGALLLATGVVVLLEHTSRIEVWSLLVVTGLGLVLKPLSKVPFSALLGLVVGLMCVGLLYLYFPLPATLLGFSSLWIYLAVFLVPALIVFLIFRFVEDLVKLFGLIVGSWPVLAGLGFLCIAQGILLLLDMSLLSFFG